MTDLETSISTGDIVEDLEGTSPNGIVVNRPPVPIKDWQVFGKGPVSAHNPEYPEDDRVIIVLYEDALQEHYPEYTGGRPIPMKQLTADGAKPYAFPATRLEMIGERGPIELSLDAINPAPFHARNFEAEANRDYIDAIAVRGRPKPIPLVRDSGERYEILNGHKRVWASYVAGLEEIPVHVSYLDDFAAAQYWAERHLDDYDPDEQQVALDRLRDRFGDRAHAIEREYLPTGTEAVSRQARADGGHDE